MGNSLKLIDAENYFLNRTLVTQAVEPTINPWYLMKLKSFCMAKDAKNKKHKSSRLQNGSFFTKTYLIDDYYLKEVDIKN